MGRISFRPVSGGGGIPVAEKGAANGVATLGATSRVPVSQLASGTPTGALFIRDDGTLAAPAGGGAAIPPDSLQNGVLLGTDAVVTGLAVSAAGVITGTMSAGTCWVKDAATVLLTRCAVPAGAFSFTPSVLPAASTSAVVGIDIELLTASGTPTLQQSAKGTDQTTVALAQANAPATAAGRVRLLDVVVTNAAGVMSLGASRDRRPWARGAYWRAVRNANEGGTADYTSTLAVALLDTTNLYPRIECTGNPMRLTLRARKPTGILKFYPWVDGADADGMGGALDTVFRETVNSDMSVYESWIVAPTSGSHRIGWAWKNETGAPLIYARANIPLQATLEEIMRPSASNGTT